MVEITQKLVESWPTWPLWRKILTAVGIPLLVLLALLGLGGAIGGVFEKHKRDEVDKKDAELTNKINEDKQQAAKVEGTIDQLNQEKKDADKTVADQDPAKFYDDRFDNKPGDSK